MMMRLETRRAHRWFFRLQLNVPGTILAIACVIGVICGVRQLRAQDPDPQAMAGTRFESIVPNPYNPMHGTVEIKFLLVRPGNVELRIYSSDGRLVAALVEEPMGVGPHAVAWDGRLPDGSLVPSGTYLCQLEVDRVIKSASLAIVR